AFAGYGAAVLSAFAEVENLLVGEHELEQRAAALRDAAEHAREASALARERWGLGLTDFLTVADAQRAAFQAESAGLTVARQRLDNRIDLLLALGGGFANPTEQPTR
ncbi:MAG: TolC family protein, partial [Planctomycetes bacterium]|nr:TolC family protein [Planctomycetota bacterium]